MLFAYTDRQGTRNEQLWSFQAYNVPHMKRGFAACNIHL